MRILITGASGFLGQNIVRAFAALDEVVEVRAIVRNLAKTTPCPKVKFHVVSTIDGETHWDDLLSDIDIVIHAAARAHVLKEDSIDPLQEYRKTNVAGTLRLSDRCSALGVKRFIFISSIGVCGSRTEAEAFTENTVPSPLANYAISKFEAEVGLREIFVNTGMDVVIIRPPLVYSADAPGNFRKLLALVERGLPLPLASIKNCRSFIALGNLVDFVVLCAQHKNAANQLFVVADDCNFSTSDVIKLIARGMNKRAPLFHFPVRLLRVFAALAGRRSAFEQLAGSLLVDISKAKNLLDWTPPIDPKHAFVKAGAEYLNSRNKKESRAG